MLLLLKENKDYYYYYYYIIYILNNLLSVGRVRFASKIISLRFDIEENTIIEAFVRFRFASVVITS